MSLRHNVKISTFDVVKYLGFDLDKRLIWNNPIRTKILIIKATKILLYFNKLLTAF